MKVKESLNVTFDETPPSPKTSPLEDDDLIKEEAIEVSKTRPLRNDLEDKSLENNEIKNIKESKSHPLENVIVPIRVVGRVKCYRDPTIGIRLRVDSVSIEKRALHKMEYDSRVNERVMQTTEEKVDSSKALDAKSAHRWIARPQLLSTLAYRLLMLVFLLLKVDLRIASVSSSLDVDSSTGVVFEIVFVDSRSSDETIIRKEMHVTWAQLEKKRDKDATLQDFDRAWIYSAWRWHRKSF
ncbi:hypothetical protein Tco_1283449 [Tanacetum coccineum]